MAMITGRDERRWVVCVSVLVGMPSHLFCMWNHMCMARHMKHPPYPQWHLAGDLLWMTGFAVAAVLSVRGNIYLRRFLLVGLIVLLLGPLPYCGVLALVIPPFWLLVPAIALVGFFLKEKDIPSAGIGGKGFKRRRTWRRLDVGISAGVVVFVLVLYADLFLRDGELVVFPMIRLIDAVCELVR